MASLRPCQDTDLAALSLLVQDFFNHHRQLKGNNEPMSLAEAEKICQEWYERHPLLVYAETDRVIGFVRLRQEGDVYWIEDIGVDQTERGQGHGRAMLAALEAYVQERGQDSLFVFVLPENRKAIEFYVANGYNILNMIELRKDLAEASPATAVTATGRNFNLEWKAGARK